MPNITIQTTRGFAVELYNLIHVMPAEQGQANYVEARAQVQKEIFRVWPEAKETLDRAADPMALRPLDLTPKHQRGIAEGALAILDDKGCTGMARANVERLVGPGITEAWRPPTGAYGVTGHGIARPPSGKVTRDGCRVWGWVEKHATQKPVPDFDGELDGEPELLDPVPVAAETAVLPRDGALDAQATPGRGPVGAAPETDA